MWSQFCCHSVCIPVQFSLFCCQSAHMRVVCKWWSLEIYWEVYWSSLVSVPMFFGWFFFFPIGTVPMLIPVLHIALFLNEWFKRDSFWISDHRGHRGVSVEAFTMSQLHMPAQYYIKWEVWHVWDVGPVSQHPQAKVNFLPSVHSKRKLQSRHLTECLFTRLTWDVMCVQKRGL